MAKEPKLKEFDLVKDAEAGNVYAQYILGLQILSRHAEFEGYIGSHEGTLDDAIDNLKKSARQGFGEAAEMLGRIHSESMKIKPPIEDYVEAAKWYALANFCGSTLAEERLDELLVETRGDQKHYSLDDLIEIVAASRPKNLRQALKALGLQDGQK